MREWWNAHWRKELLYVTLAIMEHCWFYAWMMFLLGHSAKGGLLFTATLGTLLLAMYFTRWLHQRESSLQWQRALTLLLCLANTLLLLRLYVYSGQSLVDFSWLGRFLWEIGDVMQRISPALVLFCAGLYLWLRGVALAQRDLSVETVGFSFRLGIIAFVWLFLARILIPGADASGLAFAHFFVGLVAVGLARIESVSQSRLGIRSPFDGSWLAILIGSTLALSGLSAMATALFSVRNVVTVFSWLKPVISWLGQLLAPLETLAAWLLELLIGFLIRVFSGLFGQEVEGLSPFTRIAEQLERFGQAEPVQGPFKFVLLIIKWGLLGLALATVLAILAFSVNRVRRALEEDSSKEAIWEATSKESQAGDNGAGLQNRWHKLGEEILARLATLRGQDYSLASIRQIYASLVRLAAASGFPRRAAETPYEYAATLERAFAGSSEEIRIITEAYVRAHYGERSFPPVYVRHVREAWIAIRSRQGMSGMHDGD